VKTTALTTLHELADLSHLQIATNPVDGGNQILLTNQSPVTPHQSFCLYTNIRIENLRNNSRTLTKKLNFLLFLYLLFFIFFLWLFFFCIDFTNTIFLSLFLSLHFPSFFCATSIVLPPNYSFCPFSSIISLFLYLLLLSSSTCHHTTPPSYRLTTHWPINYTNCTQSQPPAIPNTSTLHYNNRNRHKHTQGSQNPAAPTPFPPLNHLFSCIPFLVPALPITQISIFSLITITPKTPTVYGYYHQGFSK
jgi:hypothetical protein